ncbi:hypothetical protein BOTBODRAFT_145359 [Botryobasidium botryosum FD-172 SS1]|uniref:MYND-type domain-containing protein n=1 Tax=Botryobasidium botryosum (strain FD-172 SS1) TaxID=930990 RepID=A0A067MHT6_BOTB1|nr:hypothetical protein BOTBODRAFT_145359 [Botryobasidium botryosum FD-172 SS1]
MNPNNALEDMMASMGISPDSLRQLLNDPSMTPGSYGPSGPLSSQSSFSRLEDDPDTVRQYFATIQGKIDQARRLGPGPAPAEDRSVLLEDLLGMRQGFESSHVGTLFLNTSLGTQRHFSTTPLSELTRISLSEMQVRRVHKGRYLLCKVVAPPSQVVAVQLGVEDPAGDLRVLSIYNYPGTRTSSKQVLDTIFPIGTILAVREPNMLTTSSDRNCIIRVDSPSDVVFIDPSDTILEGVRWKYPLSSVGNVPRTAAEWKELGNELFKHSQFFASAVAYTNGLELDPNAYLLRLNRAAAYLRLEFLSSALADARDVLSLDAISTDERAKALFRAAQAEYALRHYLDAIDLFEEFFSMRPQNDTGDWVARCRERIKESEAGEFDWVRMFKEGQVRGGKVEAAEYVGPMKVAPMPRRGGGRCVVTAKAVKAGELILVSKAFAASFPDDMPYHTQKMTMNAITKSVDSPSLAELVSQVILKVIGNPELAPLVYDLYAGPSYPTPTYYPPLDTPSPPALQNLRVYGADVDTERIENICTYNVFTPLELGTAKSARLITPPLSHRASGLYLLPSLFNHSCHGSATWYNFKDVIVIRAARDLDEGEELTVSYTGAETHFSRKPVLEKHRITCRCILCSTDRIDGEAACRRREEIVSQLNSSFQHLGLSIADAQDRIRDANGTYSRSQCPLQRATGLAYHELAMAFMQKAQMEKDANVILQAIAAEFNALESYGFLVIDRTIGPAPRIGTSLPLGVTITPFITDECCVSFALYIAGFFHSIKDTARAAGWFDATLWLNDMCVGGGQKLFAIRYKPLLDHLKLSEHGAPPNMPTRKDESKQNHTKSDSNEEGSSGDGWSDDSDEAIPDWLGPPKEKLRDLQRQLWGGVAYGCGYLYCPERTHRLDSKPAKFQCAKCRGQRYCSPACQKAHWSIHKQQCKSYLSSGVDAVRLRLRMARFMELWASFPEHVADFTLDITEIPLSDRGKHVSLHFDDAATLEKWISIFAKQQQIESSKVIGLTVFYPVEAKRRIKAAADRSAEHRYWVNRKAHKEWLEFQRECQQWDMDPEIIRLFPPQSIVFGVTGVLLGISCIINPEDGRQTNLLYPFKIEESVSPKQARRKPFRIGPNAPTDGGSGDCGMQ